MSAQASCILRSPARSRFRKVRMSGRFRVPPSQATAKRVFLICHYCGFGPAVVPDDGTCPKCGGHSWERFAISCRLLPGSRP